MERVSAEMKNLDVTWIGTVKNRTTGKEKPSIQVMRDNHNGMKEVFYMDSIVPVDAVKVGQKIDVSVQIRAYKDQIYMTVMNIIAGANPAKPVRV